MKKFFFGVAALLSVSLFLTGCPTEAETKTVTDTVTSREGYGESVAVLQSLLDDAAINPVYYHGSGPLAIGTNTLVVPSGKTLVAKDGVTLGVGKFIVAGSLTMDPGEEIAVSNAAGMVVGDATKVLAKVSGTAVTGPIVTSPAAAATAFGAGNVALALTADSTYFSAVTTGKTLYVANTLTLAAAPTAVGGIVVLGTVSVSGDVDLSGVVDASAGDGKLVIADATLTNTAAATVKLPNETALKAVVVGSADLTVEDVTTGLTVGSITNGGGNLILKTASSVIKMAGDATNGTFTFGAEADQVLAKPTLAGSTLTLGGPTTLVGSLALGSSAKVALGASASLTTTASDAITVGEGTFTPATAAVTFPAGTVLGSAAKTVTLGSAGLSLTAGDADPKLTIAAGGVLEGKVVITGDTATNKITLDGAVLTATGSTGIALDSTSEGSVTLTYEATSGPSLQAESIKAEAADGKSIELTKATVSAGGHASSTATITGGATPAISLAAQGDNGATLVLASGGTITTAGDTAINIGAESNTALVIGGTGGAGTWTYTGAGGTPALTLKANAATAASITGAGTTSNDLAGTAGTPKISIGPVAQVTAGVTVGQNTTIDLTTAGTVALGNASILVLAASSGSESTPADVGTLILSAAESIAGNANNASNAQIVSTNGATKANTRADITTNASPNTANIAAVAATSSGATTITAEPDATGNTFTSASKITSVDNS